MPRAHEKPKGATAVGQQQFFNFFYRAMLCIRGTSHGPVMNTGLDFNKEQPTSVSVSVTSRSSTKTAKRRITQTTPHDSPGTLVF